MRKSYIYMGTYILFFTTSCTLPTHNQNSLYENRLVDNGRGKGGNPEVKSINHCFQLQNKARNRCLNIFYPNKINITIYPSSKKYIKLAGRNSSIERREFNLGGEDRFILHLNTEKVELPINCNIKTAKLSQKRDSLVVDILVKDIEDKVRLYDKNHRLILDYLIKKY